jgi:hypothetical protein
MLDAGSMRIEESIALCIALALGAWAYLDIEKLSGAEPAAESHVWRGVDVAVAALVVVLLTGVSAYLFAQVPTLLWEMTGGLFLGSLSLRFLFHVG